MPTATSTGESPDFFYASMVTDGVFFGVYQGDELIAAAGTHLVSRDESAAAIGNVYVRRDRRGRGLGRAVTAAVLHELAGIATVGLNVRADNDAAIRVYQSLGFVRHCDFREALATGAAVTTSRLAARERAALTRPDGRRLEFEPPNPPGRDGRGPLGRLLPPKPPGRGCPGDGDPPPATRPAIRRSCAKPSIVTCSIGDGQQALNAAQQIAIRRRHQRHRAARRRPARPVRPARWM